MGICFKIMSHVVALSCILAIQLLMTKTTKIEIKL